VWQTIADAALSLLFGNRCVACRQSSRGSLCTDCQDSMLLGERRERAVVADTGAAARLVRDGKSGRTRTAAALMARITLQRMPELAAHRFDCVSYIPSDPVRRRLRGGHLPDQYARELASALDVPAVALLIRQHGQRQRGASRMERRKNVANAFSASKNAQRFTGRRVLVVDDVRTTGASLEAAVLVLGAAEIEAVPLAFAGVDRLVPGNLRKPLSDSEHRPRHWPPDEARLHR
jgi:predicted amidophosphoribosyltransferase